VDPRFAVCWQCGTSRTGVPDPTFVTELDAAQPAADAREQAEPSRSYPPSRRCPRCGEERHKPAEADAWIASLADRVCLTCGCRYSPPTPLWAVLVLILIGLAGGPVSLVATLAAALELKVGAALISGVALVLSLWCMARGLRGLAEARTPEPP
jgi:hypothetical protein